MTPIAKRYGPIVLALFVAAFAATWWGSEEDRREDDCANPEVFRALQFVDGTWGVEQRPDFITGSRIQWTEGNVGRPPMGGKPRMIFRVVRTFDPYYLLVRPKALMPRKFAEDWERVEDVWHPGSDSPIRILFKGRGSEVDLIAYTYFYRGNVVRRPFLAVLEAALVSFLEKTRPITVAMVYGVAPKSEAGRLEADAIGWLDTLQKHYRAVCGPPS